MLSFGKVSSPRSLQAHIAPLESECLLRTFGSFSGGCCHGFILLITLDIDIHVNLPFLAQADEWPWAVGEELVAWRGKLAWSKMFEASVSAAREGEALGAS